MYRGDEGTKYSLVNRPAHNWYVNVNPGEMATVCQLNNPEAGQFMLKALDMNPGARTPMPDVDSPDDLQKYTISPERHRAYEDMWNGLTFVGVLANAAMWLYL